MVEKKKDSMGEGYEASDGWAAGGLLPCRATLGPLALMIVTCLSVSLLWVCLFKLDGSPLRLVTEMSAGLLEFHHLHTPSPFDAEAWRYIGGFMIFELILMRVVPGKEFRATPTATGHVPVYKANGFQCFVITLAVQAVLTALGLLDSGRVFFIFGPVLMALNLFALCLCVLLAIKGRFAPSTADAGSCGNPIIDFYWGTELYPRILGWDIKTFTNCRFGLMYWACGCCAYAHAQFQLTGAVSSPMLVSVMLQLVYVGKFFWWETGYWCSMDIQHDRAGYYICWGCLVWVPSVYTSGSYFLVQHAADFPSVLGLPSNVVAMLWFAFGVAMIWMNYDCDRQRQHFREKRGECKVWGKDPVFVRAPYRTSDGEERESLLLCSGWWGVARHFHYVPEILASVAWNVPLANPSYCMPWFYPLFLTILLLDRAFRDNERCKLKYGDHWTAYCKKVRYLIVPGVL